MRITRSPGSLGSLFWLALIAATAMPASGQAGAFGSGIALGDDEIAVSEPNTTFRPGTVYIYRRSGSGWGEAAQLRAPDATRADGFGTALARSGDLLFVAQRAAGVHVFRRDGANWAHAHVITTQDAVDADGFGASLAVAGDWLLVGAPGSMPQRGRNTADAARPGAVYAFQRQADGRWLQRARLRPADASEADAFGATLAISGTRGLAGAPASAATLAPAPRRGPPGAAAEAPPEPVTVAGAGRVYELRLENGAWAVRGALNANPVQNQAFGASIAMDGDVVVIGAPGDGDGHGAAWLYRRNADTGEWAEGARLAAFSSMRGDAFGASVAVNGNAVWVGAPVNRAVERGIAYSYRLAADGSVQAPERLRLDVVTPTDDFGARIHTRNGVTAVVAAGMHRNAGAVYVYERAPDGALRATATLVSPSDAMPAITGAERRCTDGMAGPFECSDVELMAFIPNSMLAVDGRNRGIRLNDNWGWTDPESGREYAIVGRTDGTAFVDITDPLNPALVADLPQPEGSPPSPTWRDMKVYRNHVYIVADAAGEHGIQVFDLTRLRTIRDRPALVEADARYTGINSAHNIVINEESGFGYVVGASGGGETCAGGLHIVDLREPKNPQFAGCFAHEGTGRAGRGYTHDAQCVVYRGPDARYTGREICMSSNENALSVADVTDKRNTRALAVARYPNPGYTHQGWFSEDQQYFFVDDEGDLLAGNVPTTRTTVWDLKDLEDPILVNEFMGSMPASAHNQYVKGNYIYQANYRYGLHILDITDPANPREAGHFDTAPYLEGAGFSGAWSNYPFFRSGNVIVTSVQEGLFVLKPRRPVF